MVVSDDNFFDYICGVYVMAAISNTMVLTKNVLNRSACGTHLGVNKLVFEFRHLDWKIE